MKIDNETTALLLRCERDESSMTLAFMALDQYKSRCWSIIAERHPEDLRDSRLADSLAQLKTDLKEIAHFYTGATEPQHTKTEKE